MHVAKDALDKSTEKKKILAVGDSLQPRHSNRLEAIDAFKQYKRKNAYFDTKILILLTKSHVTNCRYNRRRWSSLAHSGSERSHRRLHKPRPADIAGRRNYLCFARLPVAAKARLLRIVSALSRICNIVTVNDYLLRYRDYIAN